MSGVTATNLTIGGSATLNSFISTSGNQLYNGSVTFLSSGTPYNLTVNATNPLASPNFYSSSGNISFMGTVSAGVNSESNQRNFVVSAPNGTVLLNDQVGQNVVANRTGGLQTINFTSYNRTSINPYAVDIEANQIKLFGDVTSFETQQYRSPVWVGDNGSNGNTRLLLSLDPAITFTSSIDDVVAGQHDLVLRAITLNTSIPPTITLGNVGQIAKLAGLDVLAGAQNTLSTVADISVDRSTYIGNVTLNGSVTTANNQKYVGKDIALANGTTMRSDSGSIEMITGTAGSLGGLANATFSFGSNATGLGSNLAQTGATVQRDAVPITVDANSIHGQRHNNLKDLMKSDSSQDMSASVDVGEVQIGELTDVNCDPKQDEVCRNQ
jgi:hypothetical protein